MSNLLVQNIKHTNGTTAQTIDSSGRVLTPARPMFYAKGANTSGAGSTYNIILTATDFNVGNHYNTSTGIFTAPIAGFYQFHGNIMGDNSAARLMLRLRVNGSDKAQGSSSSISNHYQDSKLSVLLQLSANDEINLHNAGNKTTYTLAPMENYFWGMLVG